MAYEDLLQSVEESATEKEQELRRKAAAAVAGIAERAKRQAGEIRKAAVAEAERSIVAERNKALYLVRAENKELLIRAREAAFDEAFREAGLRLSTLRANPEYPEIFEKLLREATGTAGEDPVVVHVDPKDADLCKKTLSSLHLRAGIQTDLQTAGGVVVSQYNGTVVISNTVESRLERAREHNRHMIHAILSGG